MRGPSVLYCNRKQVSPEDQFTWCLGLIPTGFGTPGVLVTAYRLDHETMVPRLYEGRKKQDGSGKKPEKLIQ